MPENSGVIEKHFAIHVVVNVQVFWQSGTAGFSVGQHGMPSGISDIVDAAAIIGTLIVVTNGLAMSPTIARIGSALRSHTPIFMNCTMP